jgi:desulfoferrodoxin (superoxide reductase-like protein)
MIGWKIEYKGDICEIVGMPMHNSHHIEIIIPIYHDKVIKMAVFNENESIKVIERK